MNARSRYCGFCEEHTQALRAVTGQVGQHRYVVYHHEACGELTYEDEDGFNEARWERQQEDNLSEPPMTLDEQHRRAWEQHHEAHRR